MNKNELYEIHEGRPPRVFSWTTLAVTSGDDRDEKWLCRRGAESTAPSALFWVRSNDLSGVSLHSPGKSRSSGADWST